MELFTRKVLCFFFSLLAIVAGVIGEELYYGTYRFGLEAAAGRYIAIDQNYGGVNFFSVSGVPSQQYYFLIDARGYKLENRNWAGSFGFGIRKWDETRQKAYGFNVFYDYRYEKRDSYQQVGLGLELLSADWEAHLNGYLPVDNKRFHYSTRILNRFQDGFKAVILGYQYALRGIEFSGGKHFWLSEDLDFYVAPGFYAYNNSHIGNIQGIEGLVECRWSDYASFKINASYDSRFKGRVQGIVNLSLPLGRLLSCVCSTCKSIILERAIFRNDMIFLKNCQSIKKNWDDCGNHEN